MLKFNIINFPKILARVNILPSQQTLSRQHKVKSTNYFNPVTSYY